MKNKVFFFYFSINFLIMDNVIYNFVEVFNVNFD